LCCFVERVQKVSTYTSCRKKYTCWWHKATLLLNIDCQDTHILMKTEYLQTKWDARFLGGKVKDRFALIKSLIYARVGRCTRGECYKRSKSIAIQVDQNCKLIKLILCWYTKGSKLLWQTLFFVCVYLWKVVSKPESILNWVLQSKAFEFIAIVWTKQNKNIFLNEWLFCLCFPSFISFVTILNSTLDDEQDELSTFFNDDTFSFFLSFFLSEYRRRWRYYPILCSFFRVRHKLFTSKEMKVFRTRLYPRGAFCGFSIYGFDFLRTKNEIKLLFLPIFAYNRLK